ncbi:MAG TPA: MMPL family transporter [Acidimicrobiales bacterium]|nr:MMPL family transporter [Acidimicrobiales bacterium]
MSEFLFRLGRLTARHPYRTLTVWLLIGLAVFSLKSSFGGEVSNDFRVPGVEAQRARDLLKERFPTQSGSAGQVVFHVPGGRLDEPARKAELAASLERLRTGEHVTLVTNPFDPAGATVSVDGRTAFTNIQYDKQTLERADYEHVATAIGPTRAAGIQAEISGSIAMAANEVESREGIGLIVAVIVLLVAFGSVIAMGIPIGTALLGLGIGLGGIGLLAGFISVPDVSPMLAAMIGLGVGIDYALFVVTRHRQHLHAGMTVTDAAGRANATAGQSVLFAGTTVVIALVGLILAGIPAITTMGAAVAIVVIVAMAMAVTMLPAFLGMAGTRIDTLSVRRRRSATTETEGPTVSGRWASHVGHRPWPYAIASLVALAALAVPVGSLRIGWADDGNAASSTTQRKSYDLLSDAFGKGFNGPLSIVVDGGNASVRPALDRAMGSLKADPEIASVSPPRLSDRGDTAMFLAIPKSSPQDEATTELVKRLRSEVLPAALQGSGATALITGQTAFFEDISQKLSDRLPIFIAAVVALSFLLLTVVFRSILVPLKAALMNLLSIGAAYGVVVAVFQWGWGNGLVGMEDTIPVNPFVPLIMFAILFGLSMDYEVFLLSRIREEYVRSGDSHGSVVRGLASTARVITSAALIMISIFLAFVTSSDVMVKMFGVGLATAVFLDATLVRMVLVPSTMSLLGRANWWLPRWLDRILPRLDFEGDDRSEVTERPERELERLSA